MRSVHNPLTPQILQLYQSCPVGSMVLSDLHLIGPLKNDAARLRFESDVNVKQAVTWLQKFAIIFFSTPECKH